MQVCKQFNCSKLTYCLKTVTQEQSAPNAFTLLMQARNEKRLPAKVHGDKLRGDQKMFNDLSDLLGAMNIGWTPDLVGTAGEKVCQNYCVSIVVHWSLLETVR